MTEATLPAGTLEIEVNRGSGDDKRSVSDQVRFDDGNLNSAIAEHGEAVVYSYWQAQCVLKCQAVGRQAMGIGAKEDDDRTPLTDDEIRAKMQAFKPGVVTRVGGGRKKDPVATTMAAVQSGNISIDQLAELQAMIAEQLAAAEAAA